MTQEDKELLLKDLSARLPYGVHCCVFNFNKTIKEDNDIIYGIVSDNILSLKADTNECYMYHQIKPYLRSMSSMTEEEEEEYHKTMVWSGDILNEKIGIWVPTINSSDYLIAHHFDYRGLIPKGLALEAPEGMYIIT